MQKFQRGNGAMPTLIICTLVLVSHSQKQIARIRQERVRDEVITDFDEWLYASDLLESLSFGQKLLNIVMDFTLLLNQL